MTANIYTMPPDFVNEQGTEFWLDKSSSEYAHTKGLTTTNVYFVRHKDGGKTRLIIDNHLGKYLGEDTSIEGISTKLDMIYLDRNLK